MGESGEEKLKGRRERERKEGSRDGESERRRERGNRE